MSEVSAHELGLMDAWWRAANYLSVAQISSLANPLLAEPLAVSTSNLNDRALVNHRGSEFRLRAPQRAIRQRDLDSVL
ncbi:MAG: xylulose-5-phosphate/fructose-6-phosphate phosphoketolase [Acidimicrobiaceae bacterium]|jgi:xylulose-5-phosphate/fructose-6-phosphate phosphoketolase|nr:xylulose-5-phosphate/fructose-6-phosphate phosphoketolase [Acidimicrobiaceae bacterium]